MNLEIDRKITKSVPRRGENFEFGDDAIAPIAGAFSSVLNQIFSLVGYNQIFNRVRYKKPFFIKG